MKSQNNDALNPDETKYKKKSISFPGKLLERAIVKSNGNLSGYIQGLIERDLANDPEVHDPLKKTILIDLTRTLCGEIDASEIAKLIENKSQPKALRNILSGLILKEIPSEILDRHPALPKTL